MLSLLLCLKFQCTGCGSPIEAALQCESPEAQEQQGAIIKIPCPTCETNNQVAFSTEGTIHAVTRARAYERIPEPSVN